ncbi:GntR family transcriptional regulator [Microvirga sp. VF16]|uniref:GntR family transcriptional regulator n=1 Tax=Microvirga sp. VF16 TaxID=2807101 RepID=UPI00193DB14D|nr:GntR family transcriptional regulator [Microvirga sp. VF16]QRM32888.1 GntR family transcriptional regulator [Microvirga sp. VF16]
MDEFHSGQSVEMDDNRSRWRVFEAVRWRLICGEYGPGEKIKLRSLAEALDTSVTPVREALLQLVAAGALTHSHQRSISVPPANWETYSEVRGLRILLEGRQAAYATSKITLDEIDRVAEIARRLDTKSPSDLAKHKADLVEFHFSIYRAAARPTALRVIEGLWLQSGPYLNYLIPDYLPYSSGPQLRTIICKALRMRDAMAVAEAVETDLRNALGYMVDRLQRSGPL